ncbi:MAG: lamin tail domain-containing protein [Clostridiales bacterium]|nr:lamin tail domain-containing protein [Clostridiales bacterium]
MKRLLSVLVTVMLLCVCVAAAFAEETVTASAVEPKAKGLRISEVMASNSDTLEDAFGNTADWIELHNTTDQPIDLTGMYLSDTKKDLERYQFPDGLIIEPDGYLIIFASGLKKDVADELHTSFKLSASGESVYLMQDGLAVDIVTFTQQLTDISYALGEDGTYQFTSTPTPGEANIITPVED